MEISTKPCSRQGAANSSFSSKGTSGKISPSTPAWAAWVRKRSVP